MKNLFETPSVELIKFSVEDVVTASALIDGGEGDGDSDAFDNLFPNV